MNIDWVKSADSHNSNILILENKFRANAIISTADLLEDKPINKTDYRTNFSVDNEDVNEELEKILVKKPNDSMNSLTLLDHEYFLIQYISKHIQQYKIQSEYVQKYIRYLTWISDASLILSNRLKLTKINKEFTGELIKRTYDFCPHRSNCQINYGKKKGKCCAPHYVHNIVHHDINMMIKYLEKYKESTSFLYDNEIFKILKQINTIQFVINQMFLELSSFKSTIQIANNGQINNIAEIEKFHHNCKVDEPKPNNSTRKFCFTDQEVINALNSDEEEEDDDKQNKNVVDVPDKRTNMNVYRVWKEL